MTTQWRINILGNSAVVHSIPHLLTSVHFCTPDVLLNLFIAIVLEHFEMDEDEKYKKQLEIYFETHQRSKIDGDKHAIQYVFIPRISNTH